MSFLAPIDRCAELRGVYGQTFPCNVEYHGQSVLVVMECGRPCVDVSHPFIQRLIAEDPTSLSEFLAAIVQIAASMEKDKLEGLTAHRPTGSGLLETGLRSQGYIYIIKAENGRFKIGRTRNLKSRMSGLRTSSATLFELIHSFRTSDSLKTEEFLHEKFAAARLHGEWFELSRESVAWLISLNDFALDGECS